MRKHVYKLGAIGLLGVLLTGCQAAAELTDTPEAAAADDFLRYTPISEPVFEAVSAEGLSLEPNLSEGQGIALPGPLLLVEERYFIFINVFNEDQGPNAIYTATSEDGLTWQLNEEPILMDPPGTGSFYLATDVLQDQAGTWHLYLTSNLPLAEYSNEFSIWQATAPSLEGPWSVGEGPLLERGEPDTWDQGAVLLPFVVETDFGYMMYYHGASETEHDFETSIGVAVSVDGNEWVRGIPSGINSPYPEYENVVISRFDGEFGNVSMRAIWRTSEGWQMLYFLLLSPQQFPQLRIASSQDGIDWEPMHEPVSFTLSGMAYFPGVVDATLLPRENGYDLVIGGYLSSSEEAFNMTQIRFEE